MKKVILVSQNDIDLEAQQEIRATQNSEAIILIVFLVLTITALLITNIITNKNEPSK